MDKKQLNQLKKISQSLIHNTSEIIKWQWDDRFFGALSQFSVNDSPFILSVLTEHLNSPWTFSNIKTAPELILIISDSTGGLREGQKLFVSNCKKNPLLFATYWPWGNGKEISLRLIPTGQALSDLEMVELVSMFRSWTGV
jgi:hypothetical protein